MGTLNLEGKLTISRINHGSGEDYIEIRVIDTGSSIEFVTASVDFKSFAEALTGLGYRPCKVEIVNIEDVGKKREHKQVEVYFPIFYGVKISTIAMNAMKAFEIDGWLGDESDLKNSHRWIKGPDGGHGARVSFTRFV